MGDLIEICKGEKKGGVFSEVGSTWLAKNESN